MNDMVKEKKDIKGFIIRNIMVLVMLLMIIAMAFAKQEFLTGDNVTNVLRQISINSVLAFGMTFVIITGGIDLSVGPMVAVAGVISADLMKSAGVPIVLACLIAIAVAVVMGLINGVVISTFKVPPMIITLAMQVIGRGFAYVYTDGRPIVDLPEAFLSLGRGKLFGEIPWLIVVMIIMFAIMTLLLHKTKFGRYVFAVGGNEEAARVSGIKTRLVKTKVYALNGLMAGIAGIMLCSRINSGQPQAGVEYEMDAIAAAVIGGTSLEGGIGTMVGTWIGAIILGLINNSMNLLGVNQYYQMIVKGLIIALAVIIDAVGRKKNG